MQQADERTRFLAIGNGRAEDLVLRENHSPERFRFVDTGAAPGRVHCLRGTVRGTQHDADYDGG